MAICRILGGGPCEDTIGGGRESWLARDPEVDVDTIDSRDGDRTEEEPVVDIEGATPGLEYGLVEEPLSELVRGLTFGGAGVLVSSGIARK